MTRHYKFWPALIVSSPALITPCPPNEFPNILGANVSNNIGRNLPFCYFASFLFVSLMPSINNPDSSSDLTTFIISSLSSFEIINAVVTDS